MRTMRIAKCGTGLLLAACIGLSGCGSDAGDGGNADSGGGASADGAPADLAGAPTAGEVIFEDALDDDQNGWALGRTKRLGSTTRTATSSGRASRRTGARICSRRSSARLTRRASSTCLMSSSALT